jgi:glycerate kinase
VIAIAGTLGRRVEINLDHGIDAYVSILRRPCLLEDAIAAAGDLLRDAAASAARMVKVGIGLSQPRHAPRHRLRALSKRPVFRFSAA